MRLNIFGWVLRAENHRPMLGRCEACHWWDLQYQAPGETKGHCHRLAPMTDHNGRTLWPRTNDRQSCGQFRPKEQVKDTKGGRK